MAEATQTPLTDLPTGDLVRSSDPTTGHASAPPALDTPTGYGHTPLLTLTTW